MNLQSNMPALSIRAMTPRLSLILGILALTISVAYSDIAVVDQQNTVDGSSSALNNALGQSFTPSLSSISVADFSLRTGVSSSTVQIDLFAGAGYTGTLLGSSMPVTFTNTTFQTIEFTFATSIALVPGNQYTMRITLLSGDNYRAAFSGSDPYPGGTFFESTGAASPTSDLVFAEGIPEPSVTALLVVGVGAVAGIACRRHARAN